MSDATTLIRKALDPGVEMRFVDGQLKVTGKRKAVECWAPRLRQHKATRTVCRRAVMTAVQATPYRDRQP